MADLCRRSEVDLVACCVYLNRDLAKADDLACMYLAGSAPFGLAVHFDIATGDDELAGTAAVTQAAQLEKLIEFYVVADEAKVYILHARIIGLALPFGALASQQACIL